MAWLFEQSEMVYRIVKRYGVPLRFIMHSSHENNPLKEY